MKRVHINVNVEDLDAAVDFYSALFGARPDVLKADYARFRLDEPSMNFSISARGGEPGVDHLGIDVESPGELAEVTARLRQAGLAATPETEGACCYARSTKSWTVDPAGMAWEAFHTFGASADYGTDTLDAAAIAAAEETKGKGCCTPSACC